MMTVFTRARARTRTVLHIRTYIITAGSWGSNTRYYGKPYYYNLYNIIISLGTCIIVMRRPGRRGENGEKRKQRRTPRSCRRRRRTRRGCPGRPRARVSVHSRNHVRRRYRSLTHVCTRKPHQVSPVTTTTCSLYVALHVNIV